MAAVSRNSPTSGTSSSRRGEHEGQRARKLDLLNALAGSIVGAAQAGAFGAPIGVLRAELVAGPRAGAVELHAGLDTGRLLRALAADDVALARQFIPWPFLGEPAVYMAGRFVRLEAGWPRSLAETEVRLRALGSHPHDGGRWIAGKNELGQTVVLAVNDATVHWLFAGTTGSGKTVALRSAVVQLARDPGNCQVLIDGKWGSGLGPVAGIPGQAGPLAADISTAREALGWVVREMQRRYQSGAARTEAASLPRLIVVVDEFQELTGDPAIREMLRRILAQGRAARIHMLLATQHPTVDAFGDGAMKRNVTGRVALLVTDPDASKVAVGGPSPRADHLLGAGDAYCVTPHATHRTQLALLEPGDLQIGQSAALAPAMMDEWPTFQGDALEGGPTVNWAYSGEELAEAVIAAQQGHGRNRLVQALDQAGLGRPGAERAIRLLQLGRETLVGLQARGWQLVAPAPAAVQHETNAGRASL